jgi:hypothetical protein
MEVSEFAFRLIVLFFPGLLCAYVVEALTNHPPRTPFFFLSKALLLGFGSYTLYWGFVHVVVPVYDCAFGSHFQPKVFFPDALKNSKAPISFTEIAVVSLFSLIFGFIAAWALNKKLLFRFAQSARISKKLGELDVWGFIFNEEHIEYATIRDHLNDLVYDGWIRAFSDNAKNAEVVLGDAAVYRNSTGELLYQVGVLYLSLDRKNIAIEFRDVAVGQPVQQQAPVDQAVHE